MTDEKLIITYTPKCHHIYISFTVLYLFFCSHKCMSQYLWLWNCALFQISDCETFWFLIQALHSTTYTVNFTTIQCRQNFDYASFNSYSFHFSLYSSSMYFSFEHCKLSTYCACAFQMSVYCSHKLSKLSVYCE